ncbi:inward rectifier potassium channel protein [Cystoisospora suis]|uniref:Inward rectifier potassium channel protein n=1 Tax=Cystoisospora suis TaxID=483139 RepID=A0A2C6LBY0_9APIC|nr:inward rectifier potassium channel protein [Cystoisospora suis]
MARTSPSKGSRFSSSSHFSSPSQKSLELSPASRRPRPPPNDSSCSSPVSASPEEDPEEYAKHQEENFCLRGGKALENLQDDRPQTGHSQRPQESMAPWVASNLFFSLPTTSRHQEEPRWTCHSAPASASRNELEGSSSQARDLSVRLLKQDEAYIQNQSSSRAQSQHGGAPFGFSSSSSSTCSPYSRQTQGTRFSYFSCLPQHPFFSLSGSAENHQDTDRKRGDSRSIYLVQDGSPVAAPFYTSGPLRDPPSPEVLHFASSEEIVTPPRNMCLPSFSGVYTPGGFYTSGRSHGPERIVHPQGVHTSPRHYPTAPAGFAFPPAGKNSPQDAIYSFTAVPRPMHFSLGTDSSAEGNKTKEDEEEYISRPESGFHSCQPQGDEFLLAPRIPSPGHQKEEYILEPFVQKSGSYNIQHRWTYTHSYLDFLLNDRFHVILSMRWSHLVLLVFAVVLLWAAFLAGLLAVLTRGDVVGCLGYNSDINNGVWDYYFFIIETLFAIGYGSPRAPTCRTSSLFVTPTVISGILLNSLILGVVFQKFSAASKRKWALAFSSCLVGNISAPPQFTSYNGGVPSSMSSAAPVVDTQNPACSEERSGLFPAVSLPVHEHCRDRRVNRSVPSIASCSAAPSGAQQRSRPSSEGTPDDGRQETTTSPSQQGVRDGNGTCAAQETAVSAGKAETNEIKSRNSRPRRSKDDLHLEHRGRTTASGAIAGDSPLSLGEEMLRGQLGEPLLKSSPKCEEGEGADEGRASPSNRPTENPREENGDFLQRSRSSESQSVVPLQAPSLPSFGMAREDTPWCHYCLSFRLINVTHHSFFNPRLCLYLLRHSESGLTIRQFPTYHTDTPLEFLEMPVTVTVDSWTGDSPLRDVTPKELQEEGSAYEILSLLSFTDNHTSRPVEIRKSWSLRAIRWGEVFTSVVRPVAGGTGCLGAYEVDVDALSITQTGRQSDALRPSSRVIEEW